MVKYKNLIFWRYDLPNKKITFTCVECKEKYKSGNFCKSKNDTYLCLSCSIKLPKK